MHFILLRADKPGGFDLLLKDKKLATVKVGPYKFIVLPLGKKEKIGMPNKKYYDSSKKRWTATTALSRFK